MHLCFPPNGLSVDLKTPTDHAFSTGAVPKCKTLFVGGRFKLKNNNICANHRCAYSTQKYGMSVQLKYHRGGLWDALAGSCKHTLKDSAGHCLEDVWIPGSRYIPIKPDVQKKTCSALKVMGSDSGQLKASPL